MSADNLVEDSPYPEAPINAPPAIDNTQNESPLNETKPIEPGKSTSGQGMSERTKFIICIAALALAFILSFCTLAVLKSFGFAILFIIAFALAIGQLFIVVKFGEQLEVIKGSKVVLIVAIAFAAVTVINFIVGCASHGTAVVVIFLIAQWCLLLFYNYKILPDGFDTIKAAFA